MKTQYFKYKKYTVRTQFQGMEWATETDPYIVDIETIYDEEESERIEGDRFDALAQEIQDAWDSGNEELEFVDKPETICHPDWDRCYNVSTQTEEGNAVFYFDAVEWNGKWYASATYDIGETVDSYWEDEGPYDSKKEALQAVYYAVQDHFWNMDRMPGEPDDYIIDELGIEESTWKGPFEEEEI